MVPEMLLCFILCSNSSIVHFWPPVNSKICVEYLNMKIPLQCCYANKMVEQVKQFFYWMKFYAKDDLCDIGDKSYLLIPGGNNIHIETKIFLNFVHPVWSGCNSCDQSSQRLYPSELINLYIQVVCVWQLVGTRYI